MAIDNVKTSSVTADIVAILNSDTGEQVFEDARPVKLSSNSAVKYMQNPIETGDYITDHFIILQDVLTISCIVQKFLYRNLVSQIQSSLKQGTRFTVQTKSRTYTNMVIEETPIEEEPEKYDAIVIELKFLEVQFDPAQIKTLPSESVSNSADQSTVDRGQQSTSESSSSVAFKAAQSLGAV